MILTSLEELLAFESKEPLNLYTGDRGFFLLQRHLQPKVSTFSKEDSEKLVINNITVHYTDIIDHIAAEDPKLPHPNGGFIEQYWYISDLDVFTGSRRWPVAFDEVLEKENSFDTKELSNFLLEKYILFERKIV